ncbi:hypothetical protein [Methanospirillum hungatei]|uniref:hypothetical protein n=1 Tax=Methanospirillum hungatei TaxID=2203 RepID=UPI0026ECC313|nr:hypothetical protein [Methanospirillum hungatei]MCA1916830.1 hypothetical protein [Methanospirillum hungatei]
MAGLFMNMMKEEWRIHSTMFGSLNFALFPVMICAIAFMGTFLLPLIQASMPIGDLVILIHAQYLMLGFMVGAFGLLGNEVMNRRFGQASLLAFSARTLPMSPRNIFTIFVLKDTLYYFFLWIFPLGAGFLIGSLFTGIPFFYTLNILLTLTLSFLTGMSVVFFLSSLYQRSVKALFSFLIFTGLVFLGWFMLTGTNPATLFPPLILFYQFSWHLLLGSVMVVLVPCCIALFLFSPDIQSGTKNYPNRMKPLIRHLNRFPNPPLAAKDVIDLWRSGSIVGQTIFSFLVPLIIIWFFLSLLDEYVSTIHLLLTFAMITGIIASTMYTWLCMFDSFSVYALLPLHVRDVITSKITSFTLLQVIPVFFMGVITLLSGQGEFLLPVLVLTLSVSYYVLAVSIWLTGLSPSVLVYDVRVMVQYFLLIGIALSICGSLTSINPWFGLAGVGLFIPAFLLVRLGMRKWAREEVVGY